MVDFVKMLSHRKGDASTYRPTAGTVCLISGPNCDNENGYTYGEFEVLWTDDLFILYRKAGCWPVLNKWEHIRSKPLGEAPASAPEVQASHSAVGSIGDDASFHYIMDELCIGQLNRRTLAKSIDARSAASAKDAERGRHITEVMGMRFNQSTPKTIEATNAAIDAAIVTTKAAK